MNAYDIAIDRYAKRLLDWDGVVVVKCLLLGVTPNFDRTHATVAAVLADAANNELAVTGYTAGGNVVAGLTIATGASKTILDATVDTVFASLGAGGTIRAAVAYEEISAVDQSLNFPISFHDFGYDTTTVGTSFTVVWGADGVVAIS